MKDQKQKDDKDAPYRPTHSGILVRVKARPGMNKARALRVVDVGGGVRAFEVTVNVPPEGGKANKAIAEVLAQAFDVKVRAVSLQTGATSKIKTFEIEGDQDALVRAASKISE